MHVRVVDSVLIILIVAIVNWLVRVATIRRVTLLRWRIGRITIVHLVRRGRVLRRRRRTNVEHLFKGVKELFFIDFAIGVLINGPDSFQALLFIYGCGDIEFAEEVVEEKGEFVLVESAISIGIVLVKGFIDVGLQHLVLKVEVIHVKF